MPCDPECDKVESPSQSPTRTELAGQRGTLDSVEMELEEKRERTPVDSEVKREAPSTHLVLKNSSLESMCGIVVLCSSQ